MPEIATFCPLTQVLLATEFPVSPARFYQKFWMRCVRIGVFKSNRIHSKKISCPDGSFFGPRSLVWIRLFHLALSPLRQPCASEVSEWRALMMTRAAGSGHRDHFVGGRRDALRRRLGACGASRAAAAGDGVTATGGGIGNGGEGFGVAYKKSSFSKKSADSQFCARVPVLSPLRAQGSSNKSNKLALELTSKPRATTVVEGLGRPRKNPFSRQARPYPHPPPE